MAIDKGKQLILVGAGHSHLHLLKNIQELDKRDFKITLISPSQFYYNGVVPGEIGGIYPHKLGLIQVQCHLDPVNGVFIQDRVLEIDIQERKIFPENSPPVSYDIVSFNTGAHGNLPTDPSQTKMFPTRPVEYLWEFKKYLTALVKTTPNGLKIVVIGGGAAGVELACNIKHIVQTYKSNSEVSLYSKGNRLLSQFSEKISQKVYKYLLKKNIHVFLHSNVVEIQKGQMSLSNNITVDYDLGILATGIKPNLIRSGGDLEMSPRGGFVINHFLQCKSHTNVFTTGDCSFLESAPLWKSGYHAINQGPTLLHNIIASSENTKLKPYRPTKRMITALNLGNGNGIVIYGSFSYLGKFAFFIKDRIERRFIKSHRCKK